MNAIMGKIVFFEIEEWEKEQFTKGLEGSDVLFTIDKLTETCPEDYCSAEILSIFINSEANEKTLAQFPNLKLIVTRSVGFDHIDLAYCKNRGITVCNVPAYGAHTIAEHTFALILALSRRLIPSIENTRKADFRLDGLRGFELYGKTLGVIGIGNIGSVVIQIAQGFGLKIIAYNHHADPELEKQGVRFVTIDELLGQSDIVTIHVPLTPQTTHLINMDNISKFKKGSILINTARGGIVETQAIVEGLEKGILSGVGLDVLEEECGLKEEHELLAMSFLQKCDLRTQLLNHVLLDRQDVLITPHNAFNSKESLQQIIQTTRDNIQGFLQQRPINVVM